MPFDIDTARRNKTPRPLSDSERARVEEFIDSIHYSARYSDSEYEYRHSLGWEHYEVHEPEPHILLFKRPLNFQPPQ
ncbi:hypothetical protein ACJA88_010450 [Fusarium oxysporum]